MKHLATIQAEFLKEAREWDEMSYKEQKEYLNKHRKSKRKITAKPDTSKVNTDERLEDKTVLTKGIIKDSTGKNRHVTLAVEQKSSIPDLYVYLKEDDTTDNEDNDSHLADDEVFNKNIFALLKQKTGYNGPKFDRAEMGMQGDDFIVLEPESDSWDKFVAKKYDWKEDQDEEKEIKKANPFSRKNTLFSDKEKVIFPKSKIGNAASKLTENVINKLKKRDFSKFTVDEKWALVETYRSLIEKKLSLKFGKNWNDEQDNDSNFTSIHVNGITNSLVNFFISTWNK